MATIRPIEGRSVHQIQSGQVISDGLSSAVKELVENSLDAHATSIEVRLKNYGLDAIEVVDNGDGISRDNYESIALKHYTSKLTTYDDLENVQTFGFRGEALSSLCALSILTVITATKEDAPKGSKLEFEVSGKLKGTSIVAAQKGTTVISENLFRTLPVRRKELERNIKREYTKVLGLLQAYASIKTGVKLSVYNQPLKGKKTLVFATKANPTTRENISNVFGAKSLAALVTLELEFEMQSKSRPLASGWTSRGEEFKKVKISGYISKPIVGEGRLAPDRQMFFVNQRPCNLPQISRAFNEVYKQFNVTQSPFIFADLQMDTNAYDVNVSPDKRTILLHDQNKLLESLKASLTELFDKHEQYVPHTQLGTQQKIPAFKSPMLQNVLTGSSPAPSSPFLSEGNIPVDVGYGEEEAQDKLPPATKPLIDRFAERIENDRSSLKSIIAKADSMPPKIQMGAKSESESSPVRTPPSDSEAGGEDEIAPSSPPVARIPPYRLSKRALPEPATITIGNTTITSTSESQARKKQRLDPSSRASNIAKSPTRFRLLNMVRNLAAPGTKVNLPAAEVAEGEGDLSENEEGSDIQDSIPDEDDDESSLSSVPKRREVSAGIVDHEQDTPVAVKVEEQDEENAFFLPSADEPSDMEDNEEQEQEVLPRGQGDDEEDEGYDEEYIDEEELRVREKRKVERLIEEAEAHAVTPSVENKARAERILKGRPQSSIRGRTHVVSASLDSVSQHLASIRRCASEYDYIHNKPQGATKELQDTSPEERLTLTVSKSDFARMRIIGQFNRGFIIVTRSTLPNPTSTASSNKSGPDDLFIIDQHASDEKYNFEQLQATTIMHSQPLVRPKQLDLMAMDEEIVKDNIDILKANGFSVEVDEGAPSGQKCKLLTLPMSENTVFDLRDLEELIHLMSLDGSGDSNSDAGAVKNKVKAKTAIPRPSKVRKTFAMRACRSSVMVGKALTIEQMKKVVRHMGKLDKPWNCPHGRPTMRHLCDLGQVQSWNEDLWGCQWSGERWEKYIVEFREEAGDEEGVEATEEIEDEACLSV
ncbi:hypothetical protein EV426DRAFT_425318 [Tirmania nivea]|nr:hypothetical protein EV426DRAFT_425318 [Tirmania nivea]